MNAHVDHAAKAPAYSTRRPPVHDPPTAGGASQNSETPRRRSRSAARRARFFADDRAFYMQDHLVHRLFRVTDRREPGLLGGQRVRIGGRVAGR
jgi:hypothetical protein